jgi:hypothetical protein
LYLGHQFEKNGQRAHEKRTDYCGKWITFDIKRVEDWGDNIKYGVNGQPEKIHCGSSLCQDYHHRVIAHQKRQDAMYAEQGKKLFFFLKKKGLL